MDIESNKFMATLLVVAILINVTGTYYVTNYYMPEKITGAQAVEDNETGQAQIQITGASGINVYGAIDFGDGYITESTPIEIDTESFNTNTFNDCTNTANFPQSLGLCAGLEVENIGNTDVNITVFSSKNAQTFIGGSNPKMYFFGTQGNIESGTTGSGCSVDNLTTTQSELNSTIQTLCSNLTFGIGNNKLTFEMNLTIPDDAPVISNSKMNITFTAQQLP